MKPAAVNASPLIVLAGAGYFDLLPAILSPVVVPRAVLDEINAGPLGDPAIAAVAKAAWLSVVELNPVVSPIATWRLGRGETEVLEFAREILAPWRFWMTKPRDGLRPCLAYRSSVRWVFWWRQRRADYWRIFRLLRKR